MSDPQPAPAASHRHFGQAPGGCSCPPSCDCHEPLTVKPSDDVPRELAAAMAETRTIRDGYQALCEEFADSPQSGQSARISLTILNRHRTAAGLTRLKPAPAGEREDLTMRYRRERDEARDRLAVQHEAMTQMRASHAEALTTMEADRDQLRALIDTGQPTLASEVLAAREEIVRLTRQLTDTETERDIERAEARRARAERDLRTGYRQALEEIAGGDSKYGYHARHLARQALEGGQ